MATLEQIAAALKRADAAGDADGARKLAAAYKAQAAQQIAAPASASSKGPTPAELGWKPGQPITSEIKAAFAAHADDPVTDAERASMTPSPDTSFPAQVSAGVSAAADAVPIAGPTLTKLVDAGRGYFAHMTPEQVTAERLEQQKNNPGATMTGQIAGTVAPFVLAGTLPVASTILGLDASAPLALNMGAGFVSQGVIGAADAAVRGENPLVGAGFGALGGVAGPLLGKGLTEAGKGATKIAKVITGNVPSAAQDLISRAAVADAQAGKVLSPTDEAAAALNNQPVVNADRFGTNVRTLARTAANTDPAAKQALDDVVGQRFNAQNQRATDFVQRVSGAPPSPYAMQKALDAAKTATNNPAYKLAYSQPSAQSVWTPELKQLMQSENFRDAIKAATKTSNEEAALSGSKAIQNPFVFNQLNGSYSLRPGPNGTTMQPTLEFWDHVQRALRRRGTQLARTGEFDYDAGQVTRARTQLNDVLDNAVPEFQAARHGAAGFFGAEDAADAGAKFSTAKLSDMPGAADAINKFTPLEKRAFKSSFTSSLIDKIGNAKDSTNVINQVFGSPQSKAQIEMALGPRASQELEPFLRVENIMNQTKTAVQGGSNTAAQLAAMGATGYIGGASVGGLDPRHWNPQTWGTAAGLAALGKFGAKAAGKTIDQKVMQETARLLTSEDPALVQRAVKNAANSQKSGDAIKAIEQGISIMVRGGTTAAPSAVPQMENAQ